MRVRIVFGAALAFGVAALGCGKKEPAQVPVPPGAPAADKLKDETAKRLKQIGVGFQNAETVTGFFGPAGIVGPDGNLGLSWRVALLPYLEQGDLYKQFKLNEPWDSDHNKKLIPKMPAVFAHPAKPSPEGNTHFRALAGHDAFILLPHPQQGPPNAQHWRAQPGFPAGGRRMAEILDGTSNTLMVAETADAVPWTKPDELLYQDELVEGGAPKPGPVPKFGGLFSDGFHALMMDGKVVSFPDTLSEKARRAIITVAGGERDSEAIEIVWPLPPKGPPAPVGVPDAYHLQARNRRIAVQQLQELARAAHKYNDAFGQLPGGYASEKGPGLSWRVALLPYIGYGELFKQFKLDEPWDGPTNKALIEKMPLTFKSYGKGAHDGHTFLRTTQGPGGVIAVNFDLKGKLVGPPLRAGAPLPATALQRIADGSSNTLLFVEGPEAVPWTKPDELTIPYVSALGKGSLPVPELGGVFPGGFHAAFADGTVLFFMDRLKKEELAKLLTPQGGEVIDDRAKYAEYLGEPLPDESKPNPPKTETKSK